MRGRAIVLYLAYSCLCQGLLAYQNGPPGQGQQTADFHERYFRKRVYGIRDSKEVVLSYYDLLLEIDRNALSIKSATLLDDILKILGSPTDEALRHQYMRDFPRTYAEFLKIFHPPGFKELCSGADIFIQMFKDIISERPQEYASFLLGLAKDAKFLNYGAPIELQRVMASFICDFLEIFVMEFDKLKTYEQDNIIVFICDHPIFPQYSEYKCIVKELEEKGKADLLKRFEKAKVDRIIRGDATTQPLIRR